jgi:hypothetical protein
MKCMTATETADTFRVLKVPVYSVSSFRQLLCVWSVLLSWCGARTLLRKAPQTDRLFQSI